MTDEWPTGRELIGGIWLSEQTPEKQRTLWEKCFYDSNCAWFVVLSGEDRSLETVMKAKGEPVYKNFYQDIIFGGNEADTYKQGEKKASERGFLLTRVDLYRVSGKWSMSQHPRGFGEEPPKKKLEIPHEVMIT